MLSHILFSANEVITQNYSPTHEAIDVVGADNTVSDVIAYEDGTVVLVVDDVTSNNINTTGTATYGNFIKIKHGNNIQTLYAHLKYGSIKVKQGDYVKKGQVIGTMGNTGRAFGVHLHFEVRDYNENRKNPYDYLWETDNSPTVTTTKNENITVQEVQVSNTKETNDSNQQEAETSENTEEIKNNEEVAAEVITSEETEEIIQEEIMEEDLNKDFTLFENSAYKYMSLVDALDEIYVNNDYEYRTKLALKNGIDNYTGSKIQNLKLLQLLKEGKLKAVY